MAHFEKMESFTRILRTVWHPSQEKFLPSEFQNPEVQRHAQLILGFSTVGGLFSIVFAFYYLIIGHYTGTLAILTNSLVFLTLPMLCLKRGKADLAGLIFVLSLISMFSWLSLIEGGVNGHAVAWLVTMPLCSQLLILKRRPMILVNFLMLILIMLLSGIELLGIKFPVLYPGHYHGWVTLVGYTGLGIFMFTLGFILEYYRRKVIVQRDLAEAELNAAVEELTRLNLEKNEFLGIAAHDLNNPLSVVYGYAEEIRDYENILPSEVKEFAFMISESSKRMQHIIQDVLDVNQIEAGKYPLRKTTVDLKPLFTSCLRNYRDTAAGKGLKIQAELSNLRMETDEGALGQILDNLVSNAVKYALPEGSIQVDLRPCEGGIEFEVFNEGRGFTAEDKLQLFTRFSKLSTRPTAGEGSVGLGLSITQKIVEALDGEIHCESELNQGARFRIFLPGETE